MIILGIADHVNSGASLIIDGKVAAAVNEERLARKKMVFGVPRESIRKMLELERFGPERVGMVAVVTSAVKVMIVVVVHSSCVIAAQVGGDPCTS